MSRQISVKPYQRAFRKPLRTAHGEWAILGAQQGADFGRQYKDNPDTLNLINDFDWLKDTFDDAI